MIALALAVAFISGIARVQGEAPTVSLSDLDAVKSLYTAAAYEDTLQRVGKVEPGDLTVYLEQYRALSLLALGRGPEAERAFEHMVRLDPRYHIPETDVSPRVATLFKAVRQRVLPSVARDLYEQGKSSFDRKQFVEASEQLKNLLAVVNDSDVEGRTDFDDLKLLADGFIRLSELELALAARATPPPDAKPADAAAAPSRAKVYSAADTSVRPPTEIERRMPPWTPSSLMARNVEYTGIIEVIVGESGAVESAGMSRPAFPPYDQTLLVAAKNWKFKPATQDGRPVKYRLSYSIVLAPAR